MNDTLTPTLSHQGRGQNWDFKIPIKKLGRVTALFLALISSHPSWAAPAAVGRLVHLKTTDGWTLTAWFVPAGKGSAVILLHGLAAGKGEWLGFQDEMSKRGIATLAIDLRGHGDSLGADKTREWKTFVDHGPSGEWAHMWKDAEAGERYLKKQGFKRIGAVGASIGANIVLSAATRIPGIRFAALLSPGLDYQGLHAGEDIVPYGIRPLLIGVSSSDGYAYQSSAMLRNVRTAARMPIVWIEAKAGHGVQMFSDPTAQKQVADWIADNAR